jgi:hypothetical protein
MATAQNRLGRGYSRVSVRCLRLGLGPATTATRNTIEDVCSRIMAPAVHEYVADDDVTRIRVTARERGSQ